MNQDLGLKVLGHIMNWPDDRARQEFNWLKLMARLKYDSYRDFRAGMRFIESLVTWLQQFEKISERETAYKFVRRTLVYIGPSEMQRIVEQFYPRFVRDRIARMVADECDIPLYRVLSDENAKVAEKRLRRQTLFMGLSDGARVDTIRHTNSGILNNEQIVQVIQINIEKWENLLNDLRRELRDPNARFRIVYLIDDFAGTGTSFLRFNEKREKWEGKLIRFKDSVESVSRQCKLFEENWKLCIHHHIASRFAVESIASQLEKIKATDDFCNGWDPDIDSSFGMIFPSEFPINTVPGRHDDFIELTQTYYDSEIQTRHTKIGGVCHLGLGYGGCALPLVLEHNTPNNAIALLWAATNGSIRNGVKMPAMRPLFRRRERHTEKRVS